MRGRIRFLGGGELLRKVRKGGAEVHRGGLGLFLGMILKYTRIQMAAVLRRFLYVGFFKREG